MNKKSLSVFHGNCKKDFFRSLKWAWQRATKGYCDRDAWDLDDFYTRLFVVTLRNLGMNCISSPEKYCANSPKGDELQVWRERLFEMSILFEDYLEENRNAKNEYYSQYMECIRNRNWEDFISGKRSPEEEKLGKLYNERQINITAESIKGLHKAFDMLKEDFIYLWD